MKNPADIYFKLLFCTQEYTKLLTWDVILVFDFMVLSNNSWIELFEVNAFMNAFIECIQVNEFIPALLRNHVSAKHSHEDYRECTGFCDAITNPYVILGLIIWLVLLTLAFFGHLLSTCCCSAQVSRTSRHEQLSKRYDTISYVNNGKDNNAYSEVEEGRTMF